MVLQVRYIFGCDHPKRNIRSNVIFERDFKIPALYCEDCCKICSKCLVKTKTRIFENAELCENCFPNKHKFTS
jgi:hypothetical protein